MYIRGILSRGTCRGYQEYSGDPIVVCRAHTQRLCVELRVEPPYAELHAEPRVELRAEPRAEPLYVKLRVELHIELCAELRVELRIEPCVELRAEPRAEPLYTYLRCLSRFSKEFMALHGPTLLPQPHSAARTNS